MAAASPSDASALKSVDCVYTVLIAPDQLSAWLTVMPPEHGGSAPDMAAAHAALGQAGVVFGIDEAAVATALGPALGTQTAVAHGMPTQAGVDGWLEPLVTVNQQRHPKVDEHGHADFRDRGATPSVNPGDALMRRHPPQPGMTGRGVTGRELPVASPKNIGFGVRLQGVQRDPQDPDLLRAAVAGQPILLRDGVTVEPILRLEAVGIDTGNIEFVGSVEIHGDVQSNMHIRAGGDIIVGGVIESAELVAGGDVIAHTGVIGHSVCKQKEGQKQNTARLTAKGSVKARYLENCVVFAEHSVIVDEAIIQCEVTAIDQIVVGTASRGNGRVIGGSVRATSSVTAEVLGGPGSTQTRVFVGINPLIQQALEEHTQHLETKLRESGELTKVLQLLKSRPDKREIAERARLTLMRVNEEIAEIVEEERALRSQVRVADQARVVVSERVHGGVTVAIGKKSRFVAEELGPGVFLISNGELVYGDVSAHGR